MGGYIAALQASELNETAFFANRKADQLLIQISNEPKLSGRYIRFAATVKQTVIKKNSKEASGHLLVIIPASKKSAGLNYGDQLLIKANFNVVPAPYNPAEFNYKQYLAYQNIHYQAFIDPREVRMIKGNAGNPLIAYALNLRRTCVEHFKAGIKDSSAAAVASTLILGYKADLSNDIIQAYSKTGTLHVLSVSGAHVAIIYALILVLLSWLKAYHYGHIWSAVITVALIWAYSLLTGFSPAVCRAALMITFYILGRTFFRQVSSLNLLAASAFVLLLFQPLLLADVGFQLSYCAVFGLFVFQPVIYKLFKFDNKWLNKFWLVNSASIAAQLATFPLSVYYFHQFPIYFLISNLLIIIPTEIIMVAGGAYLIFYQIRIIAAGLGWLLKCVITWMNICLIYIESLPFASINGLWFTEMELVFLVVLMLCIILALHQRNARTILATLACVLVLFITAAFKNYQAVSSRYITFFNLKHHTGILLKSGKKGVLITDLNTNDKAYLYSLKPYLDSCRIEHTTVVNQLQNVSESICRKKGNYVQFITDAVLIADTSFHYQPLQNPVKIKYLYITNSPKYTLNLLAHSYIYTTVIAGANNSNQTIERYRKEAEKQHKIFISLKRNKSFVVASN
ncbi:ComEC/Rec2 family competence protein [Mucilaginibacter koreensis]